MVSCAADNALTFAGGSIPGPAVVTSEFKINYVRPGGGNALMARANVIHAGKTQAACRREVFSLSDVGEVLCAVAQGTIVALSQRQSGATHRIVM